MKLATNEHPGRLPARELVRTRHLLIVEDNSAHARLLRMALSEQPRPVSTDWVADGDEAVAYLHRRGRFADRGELDLILLDLRLPKIDGFGVLREIKSHNQLKDIPVVILTTSSQESDIQRAQEAGANAFLVKPLTYDEWEQMAGRILDNWCVDDSLSQRFEPAQPPRADSWSFAPFAGWSIAHAPADG